MSGPPFSPEIRIGEASEVAGLLAADLAECARRSLLERRRFALAIPGGSVATRCFPLLATLPLDWPRVDFFWADERAVPPDHPDSNYALAERLWLKPSAAPAGCVHRMRGEEPDLPRAAREYALELTGRTGDPPRLDYVLLGVGPDGHVASLFPGHPALRDPRPVLAVEDAPKPPHRRLSLSLPVLIGARRVAIVAFGSSKAAVIRQCREDAGSSLPVALVARQAERCLLLLDRAAAAGSSPHSGAAR